MRKQDIRTGVVYAWQRSLEYSEPQPVVFLAAPADRCLFQRRSYHDKGTAFVRVPPSSRPQQGRGFSSSTTGYPVVFFRDGKRDQARLLAFTLEQFEAAGSPYLPGLELSLAYSLTPVRGLYAEVHAEWEARQAAKRAGEQEADARLLDQHQRGERVVAVLAGLGVSATWHDRLELTLEQAEKLAALLGKED